MYNNEPSLEYIDLYTNYQIYFSIWLSAGSDPQIPEFLGPENTVKWPWTQVLSGLL